MGRDEELFTTLFRNQVQLVHEIGFELAKALKLSAQGKNVKGTAEKIIKLEREIDDVRTNAEGEVYKSSFLPFTRVDRLLLLEDMDSVADIAEEIAIILLTRKLPDRIIGKDVMEVSKCLEKTMDALDSLLNSLVRDTTKLLDAHELVRLNRRETKDRVYKTYQDIFSMRDISAVKLNVILEVLDRIIVMSRKIGDVADRARAMTIKYL